MFVRILWHREILHAHNQHRSYQTYQIIISHPQPGGPLMNRWWTNVLQMCYRCATGNPVGVDERVEECWAQKPKNLAIPYLKGDGDWWRLPVSSITKWQLSCTRHVKFCMRIHVGKCNNRLELPHACSALAHCYVYIYTYMSNKIKQGETDLPHLRFPGTNRFCRRSKFSLVLL